MSGDGRILLTGASGYVGGRLLPRLEATGRPVRCLARRPEYLRSRVRGSTEVVGGDLLDVETLPPALQGIETAYYLVHSMGAKSDFEERDRQAALNFGEAARRAGVRRVVYLGGLAEEEANLSPHLRSRHEVGQILRDSGCPVIEFRASIVIGSGSLSFEMIRSLVEALPVMVTPSWVRVQAQPISIQDLLAYLERALEADASGNPIYEIGGADRVSYAELMKEYARQRGLRRYMVPVPVLTPSLSSLWLGLVTPLYARIGRKLIGSITHATLARDDRARRPFEVEPNEESEFAETRWSDALSSAGAVPASYGGLRVQGRLVDSRARRVSVSPERGFAPIRRIGGATGWYAYQPLWRIRGFLDLLAGGVGMRRGRPDPEQLHVGDTVDWWRVESIEPGRSVCFFAEMKVPGRAWLEYEVTPDGEGSMIRQTVIFAPSGLAGLAYWYLAYPAHALVFRGMVAGISAAAERGAAA
jgi:uncharacterized protein YbjT (DUF2867 family)